MNLIQILNKDGSEFGLFTHPQYKDLQPVIDLCESRAETVYESRDNNDEDDLLDLFLDELFEEGFDRVFIIEEYETSIF